MTSVINSVNVKMLNPMPWKNGKLPFLKLLILVFHFTLIILIFNAQNLYLLFLTLSVLSRFFFYRKYVLVPADKDAINVVVVWRLYYVDTLKPEIISTNPYKLQASLSEKVVVDGHGCHTALKLGVKAKENQDKLPTLNWLPNLH